jgi:hypothetical protein
LLADIGIRVGVVYRSAAVGEDIDWRSLSSCTIFPFVPAYLARTGSDPFFGSGLACGNKVDILIQQRMQLVQSAITFFTQRIDRYLGRDSQGVERHFIGGYTWLITTLRRLDRI